MGVFDQPRYRALVDGPLYAFPVYCAMIGGAQIIINVFIR
jgi:hypothetical protein